MTDDPIEFSLVLPCLDEAETLSTCIDKALGAVARLGLRAEVIVADNGSTDGSIEIAEQRGARVVPVARKGYGSALQGGIAAARGKYVIMADADDSYDWSRLDPFVEQLRQGSQLVMGCRLPAGGGTLQPGAMPVLHRLLGNPVLSFLGRLFFGCPVTDFHCGFRGFDREAMTALGLRTTGMEFASEMVIRASLSGLSIAEVPITLYPDGRSRPPHLRTWRDGWRHLRFMLMYSPRWLYVVPSLLLIGLGLAGFVMLLRGPVRVGGVSFDVNTLLVCALALTTGVQIVVFGFFARVYAHTQGLLPEDRGLPALLDRLPLEAGVALGLLLALAGSGWLIKATFYWKSQSFGPLDYPTGLRMVIPATTLIALGLQAIFSSFFLGLLRIEKS